MNDFPDPMVEAAAKVLWGATTDSTPWERCEEGLKQGIRRLAREALEAAAAAALGPVNRG